MTTKASPTSFKNGLLLEEEPKGKRGGRRLLTDTLQEFRNQCELALQEAIRKTFPEWAGSIPRLTVPSNLEFGELSSTAPHELARERGLTPHDVAASISQAVNLRQKNLIAAVEEVSGYLNFRLDYRVAGGMILGTVVEQNKDYGIVRTAKPSRISVEHTSANPSGPLTMGHARNSILGDALARLLKARGHYVTRRFYIDDVGRQVSILAYGYKLLGKPKPQGKVDHWLGRVYACTNCALQIEITKNKLSSLGDDADERLNLQRALDEWVAIAAELEAADKELFQHVVNSLRNQPDPEKDVEEIGRNYEKNEESTSALVREVAHLCLGGMKATLDEMEIEFDAWDWESDLIWSGKVKSVLNRLIDLPFVNVDGTSSSLNVDAVAKAYSLREHFQLSETYEVPPLTLVRSDGTTLYPTRDMAYTIAKFSDSDKVINVIASEQKLPQLQIRLALYALGEREAALNLVHYAYGLVELPGAKMSKRRARYVALDEVIAQAKARVETTMASRKEQFDEKESNEIITAIALGAIRFAMLSLNSMKNLTFTWDRVLSLERNSSPFINYAYTRATSILRKVGEIPKGTDASVLTHPLERLLIFKIGQMPQVFIEAADQLKPEEIANHANSLAEKFHEYYEKVDVIHASEQVKNARALLVEAVQITLRNCMELLGIRVSERM
jgi:arginyl-tRNA synthetase